MDLYWQTTYDLNNRINLRRLVLTQSRAHDFYPPREVTHLIIIDGVYPRCPLSQIAFATCFICYPLLS